MKRVFLAFLLMLPAHTLSAASKSLPNPADFNVTVHVTFSHYNAWPSAPLAYQQLDTIIDGAQVVLQCNTAQGVLLPGDYKAKRIDTNTGTGSFIPKKPNGFDIFRIYDLLMPDGMSREFFVVGLGSSVPAGATQTNP